MSNPSGLSADSTQIDVSVVITVRDEEECVTPLLQEISESLADWVKGFEVIVVDDGSCDRTSARLRSMLSHYPFLRCFSLGSAQGKSAGLAVGCRAARGTYIVTIDGDLQNDPSDIPTLVDTAGPRVIVCGTRGERAAGFARRIASRCANFVRRAILADGATDSGCGFKVIPSEAVTQIPWIRGVHRFLPAVLKAQGYRVVNTPIRDRRRRFGTSKYRNLGRLRQTVPDLIGFRWWSRRQVDFSATELQATALRNDQRDGDRSEASTAPVAARHRA